MILTKEVEVKITPYNIKHFKSLGYSYTSIGEKIFFPVEKLTPGSNYVVHVKCDICGKESYIKYQTYIKNYNNCRIYSCKGKCATFKNELTNLKKFGVKNVFQSEDIKARIKETNIKNLGVEYPMQSDDVRRKSENTILKKYGCKNIFQNDEIKEKSKKSNLRKRGVEYACQSKACKEKTKATNIKKYGTSSPAENEDIKNKIIKTNLKKYKANSPLQNKEIREKAKKTILKKYGVEFISQNEEIRKKIEKTNIERFENDSTFKEKEIYGINSKGSMKIKIHKDTGLRYQGTYEKHFLDFCFENNIPIKRAKTIRYYFKSKKRIYYPDYYLDSKKLIVEVKSTYTYKKHLEKNIAKKNACIGQGFSFIFIIDKDYSEFIELLNNRSF
jgi:hypothetical protein